MSCPSCKGSISLVQAIKNADRAKGIITCPNCHAALKAQEKNERNVFIGGLLAFLGGPINNWIMGSNNIVFLVTYSAAAYFLFRYFKTSKYELA